MNHLIYISGPPCSGKSTICKGLLACSPTFGYVGGDTFWRKHEGLPFEKRVPLTNTKILESVKTMTDSHVLLEWVPSVGAFHHQLQNICETTHRVFTHIVLFAPLPVLQERKMKRDGDDHLGQPDREPVASLHDAIVINTTHQSEADIVKKCLSALIERDVLPANDES